MRVSQIMSTNVHFCRPADSLECPVRLMWEHDVGSVPIVDDAGHVVGIVTDRDACMAAYTQGKRLSEITTSEIMSRTVISVGPSDPVSRAEILMQNAQIRRMPVIEPGGQLVGMLSQNDLVRASVQQPPGLPGSVPPEEITLTLAAIGRRRDATAAPPYDEPLVPPEK